MTTEHWRQEALRPQWKRAWLIGPPSSPQFGEHLDRFQSLLAEDDYLLFQKFLVWFQAEHTIPNPLVLNLPQADIDGASLVRMADLLGWPSDLRNLEAGIRVVIVGRSIFAGAAYPECR